MQYRIEARNDGGCTVWCAEIERMFRTKGTVGFTLHPDRACLELDVRLFNRTSEPQTFLWWANPAVHVNDEYQSVFPPDVHAVMDHGKRDVSDFPIATGTYYKVNYAPGTDISRYKNIPVPTSYMAYHSDFDFLGCYDHGVRAGMMHVADHHVVPGKKQWTWGHGDFGRAWDRQLTDEDGPYIELMCGAYTDNQPDFSWLMPGEEKRFTQVFLPYKAIGAAQNASRDAVLSLDVGKGAAGIDEARLGVYVTAPRMVTVRLTRAGATIFEVSEALSPEGALLRTVPLDGAPRPQELTLEVWCDGRRVLAFTPRSDERPAIPAPATPARAPEAIASNDELFVNGLHLEQYRHATFAPEPYYVEALRRDPGDARCNNALGLLLYRRGKVADSEPYFRRAIARVTSRNPNPYDGEPYYNLGLALRMLGRPDEAFDAFYKAVWNEAWQAPGYFELARLAARRGDPDAALDLVRRALVKNFHQHRARHLEVALLRRLGREDEARAVSAFALALDPTDAGARYERRLLCGERAFDEQLHGFVHDYVELALDYAHAGLFTEALALLDEAPPVDPMVQYYAGHAELQRGDEAAARARFAVARATSPDYCFPNRLECVPALEAAIALEPNDARAPYYLGNFWYAHRRYDEAVACWERARALGPAYPTVHRNLGLAYMNRRGDADAALAAYERAFALDPTDARVFFELDQLQKTRGASPDARRDALARHPELLGSRDDLRIEYITLLNRAGAHDDALAFLRAHTFHPWEGGEGKATGQYVVSLVELAKRALDTGDPDQAIALLTEARTYPPNLGEGKLPGAQENQIRYSLGLAHEARGNADEARGWFERAAVGLSEPTSATYYNDQPPDTIYYQGLARRRLGREVEARDVFQRLVDYGAAHMGDDVRMDYFAVSLPDFLVFDEDLNRRNRIQCHYIMGLGYLGLGQHADARRSLGAALALDPAHLGASLILRAAPEGDTP